MHTFGFFVGRPQGRRRVVGRYRTRLVAGLGRPGPGPVVVRDLPTNIALVTTCWNLVAQLHPRSYLNESPNKYDPLCTHNNDG
jgi:hypothetical protein